MTQTAPITLARLAIDGAHSCVFAPARSGFADALSFAG